jgi:hypothetical protein
VLETILGCWGGQAPSVGPSVHFPLRILRDLERGAHLPQSTLELTIDQNNCTVRCQEGSECPSDAEVPYVKQRNRQLKF